MEVFRIAKSALTKRLITSGRANRWNQEDQFVIYTGSSRSLSTLELIVHKNSISPAFQYQVMIISIVDEEKLFTQIFQENLSRSWRSMEAYPELQQIGSKWYQDKQSLVLKVPSAIIVNEYNYIINTKHPDFNNKVSLVRTEDYFWDDRLL